MESVSMPKGMFPVHMNETNGKEKHLFEFQMIFIRLRFWYDKLWNGSPIWSDRCREKQNIFYSRPFQNRITNLTQNSNKSRTNEQRQTENFDISLP